MMYIAGALQTFKKLGPQKRQMIALEIAVLGRAGLDINDSTDKYTLKSLPGKFSGLHLQPSCTPPSGRLIQRWTPARTSRSSTKRR